MKYLKLFDSYSNDINYSNIARNIYNKIKKNIKNIKFEPLNENDTITLKTGNQMQLEGCKFNLKQIDKRYDINLIFLPNMFNTTYFFNHAKNYLGFCLLGSKNNIFPDEFKDFNNNVYLAKIRFESWIEEDVFIHEFIHYLDSLRYGKTYKFDSPKNDEIYYNSPEEINAIYHEILNKILKNKNKFKKLTYKEYLKQALNIPDLEFIENISDDNLRKLKTRLYKIYVSLK